MKISFDHFKTIITAKALHEAGVHAIPRAHAIMVRQYCDKLTLRSACSGNCAVCALKIRDAVAWLIKNKAERPYGLYTYLLKNASGQRVEEMAQHRASKPEANAFGEATGRDGLDILWETLA